MKAKQTITIIIVALIIGTAGVWAFFLLRKNPSPPPAPTPQISIAPGATSKPTPSPTNTVSIFDFLSGTDLLQPRVYKDNTVIFYDNKEGYFKKVTTALKQTKEEKISDYEFKNIISFEYSSDTQSVLLKYKEDLGLTKYSLFNFSSNNSTVPGIDTQTAILSPTGKQMLVYERNNTRGINQLALISADGAKKTKIMDLEASSPVLYWPHPDFIFITTKPAQNGPAQDVFLYNVPKKTLERLQVSPEEESSRSVFGINLILPSLDGKRLFVFQTDQNNTGGIAYILNLEPVNKGEYGGGRAEIINLPFSTLPEKCAWGAANDTLYCAYATEFGDGKHMVPFGYWKGELTTNDSFARFNWKTGELKIYAENTSFDATEVSVSPDESFLIFVNRKDMNLYKMKL